MFPGVIVTTTWFTAAEAAAYVNRVRAALSADAAGCGEQAIRNWVNRGHLAATGINADGLQVFTLGDVAKAELATRSRALRLVGIGIGTN